MPMIKRRKVDLAGSRPTFGAGVLLASCIRHVIVAVICSGAGRQIPKSVETRGRRRTVGVVGSRPVRRGGVLLTPRTLCVVVTTVTRKPRARKTPKSRNGSKTRILTLPLNPVPAAATTFYRRRTRGAPLVPQLRESFGCAGDQKSNVGRQRKRRKRDRVGSRAGRRGDGRLESKMCPIVVAAVGRKLRGRRMPKSKTGRQNPRKTSAKRPRRTAYWTLRGCSLDVLSVVCRGWNTRAQAVTAQDAKNRASAENTNEIAQILTSPDHIPAAPKTSVWCCTCSTLRLRRFASANSARRRPKSKSARKCNEIDEKSTSPERVPKASGTFFERGSYDASPSRRSRAQYRDARGKIARWSKIQRKTSKSRCRRIGFQRPRGRPLGFVHAARRWRRGWVRIEARGKTSTARGTTVIKTANPDGVERVRDAHNRRRRAGEAICGGCGRPGAAVRRARSEFHPEKRSRRRSFDRRAAKTREHRERTVLVRSEGCAKL